VINKIRLNGSKSFAEVRSDDDCWIDGELSRYEGVSFVKVFPPGDATDEQIKNIKQGLKDLGSEVVKIMPKASTNRLVSKIKNVKRKSIRKVVIEYAEGIVTSEDKGDLIDELNSIMDQVGL
jgi:hypothetical protein